MYAAEYKHLVLGLIFLKYISHAFEAKHAELETDRKTGAVDSVRQNVTIDWTMRENVRAKLRVLVKSILRKYGYPPDTQEKATQTVLEQAEVLSAAWATLMDSYALGLLNELAAAS
jgi:type I restriction-modification system DNA methylase subunit